MKIAYLSVAHIPSRTAYSVHVMKMAHAFAQHGHDVTTFAFAGDVSVHGDPFAFYDVPRRFRLELYGGSRVPKVRVLRLGRSIMRLLRREGDYDLLYSRHAVLLLCCARLGLPMIYESHGPPARGLPRLLEPVLLHKPNFSHLVVISHGLAGLYRETVPRVAGVPMLVVPDAADPPDDMAAAPASTRRNGAFQVGYVGSLYRGRGIELIARLAADNSDMAFHVVGGAPEAVAEARNRFGRDNLHWHGHVSQRELASYYAVFDMVIAPYQRAIAVAGNRGDTAAYISPLKLFEYMAHRKAIVASNLPPLREVLEHGRNALLVSPEDVAGWNAALRLLESEPALRARLANEAHEEFLQRYTWSGRVSTVLSPLAAAG
jgi:glycosyltransferase involved in cell wall biosynthesis